MLPMYETSFSTELLLPLRRGDPRPLRGQIEGHLRHAIRSGALRPGTRLPSTRDLASQLGISRGVVVDAYAQLGAEGYLVVRQGSRPRVSETAAHPEDAAPPRIVETVRFDFRLGVPDVSGFPRDAWLRSVRSGISSMTTADLGYGDARGTDRLRTTLAE